MTGKSEDIDTSLANIWRSWYRFRQGKRRSSAIDEFEYYLERNLHQLHIDINNGSYRHGQYAYFTVHDTKPRKISVANIRDRVVHRLLYDHLVGIWDKTFITDVWSCRPGKGLHGAINRADSFMAKYPKAWVWRSDIKKMFDSIDHDILKSILRRRVHDLKALWLLDEVIESSQHGQDSPFGNAGLPIGNLTSQAMVNIYLNEFDRYIVHEAKPLAYLRYGDDWLCFLQDKVSADNFRVQGIDKLTDLDLSINPKVDRVVPAWKGLSYLGVNLWSGGHYLQPSVRRRIKQRATTNNAASYRSLIQANDKPRRLREFDWYLSELD